MTNIDRCAKKGLCRVNT